MGLITRSDEECGDGCDGIGHGTSLGSMCAPNQSAVEEAAVVESDELLDDESLEPLDEEELLDEPDLLLSVL